MQYLRIALATLLLSLCGTSFGEAATEANQNSIRSMVEQLLSLHQSPPQEIISQATVNGVGLLAPGWIIGVVNLETGEVCEDFRAYCPEGLYIANNPDSRLHASWWSPDAVGEAILNARPFRGIAFNEITLDLVNQVGANKVQFVTDLSFNDTIVVDTGNGLYKVGFAQCLVPFGSYLETPMPWCEDTIVAPVVEKIVFSYTRLD